MFGKKFHNKEDRQKEVKRQLDASRANLNGEMSNREYAEKNGVSKRQASKLRKHQSTS